MLIPAFAANLQAEPPAEDGSQPPNITSTPELIVPKPEPDPAEPGEGEPSETDTANADSTVPQEAAPEVGGLTENGRLWLLLAGAAAAAVMIAIVTFALMKRRKPELAVPPACDGAIITAAMQNLGSYPEQEDSYFLSDSGNSGLTGSRGVLAVVADGMGGLADGAQMSRLVCDVFGQLFPHAPDITPPEKLLYLLETANDEVNRLLMSKTERSGTTLVAALLYDRKLWFISVGDSCIALIRNGAMIQLNREHTYAVELDETASRGEISVSAAKSDPQRAALTSYIGMGNLKYIDRNLQPLELVHGDFVLLMSDGVFKELSAGEISSAVYGDAQDAALRLENLVLGKGDPKQDNFTVLLLKYT